MSDEKLYQLALTLVPKVGPRNSRLLISHFGSASDIFSAPRGKLKKVNGIGEKIADQIANPQYLKDAEQVLKKASDAGVETVFFTDEHYPHQLKQIYDAPLVLFKKGKGKLTGRRTLAIVGTRSATDYGKETTRQIVKALKPYDPVIISGLAYGIDIEAHRAALDTGLSTFAVMASGPDIIYPSAHRVASEKMQEEGGLLTEYPPGTKPEAAHFPARNRIIAGLSEAVVVVEAAVKGGALITADIAHSYDRDVLAVPGNLGQSFSEGCNRLIEQQKAHIFTDADNLARLLNWHVEGVPNQLQKKSKPDSLSNEESKIWDALHAHPAGLHFDLLSWNTQIPIHQLASVLLSMEFEGYVKALPGKLYKIST